MNKHVWLLFAIHSISGFPVPTKSYDDEQEAAKDRQAEEKKHAAECKKNGRETVWKYVVSEPTPLRVAQRILKCSIEDVDELLSIC